LKPGAELDAVDEDEVALAVEVVAGEGAAVVVEAVEVAAVVGADAGVEVDAGRRRGSCLAAIGCRRIDGRTAAARVRRLTTPRR